MNGPTIRWVVADCTAPTARISSTRERRKLDAPGSVETRASRPWRWRIRAAEDSSVPKRTDMVSPTPMKRRRRRAKAATLRAIKTKRSTHTDDRGRQWTVSVVPCESSDEEDFRFWYEELSAEERVNAVHECLRSALKAQGINAVPGLRRVSRRVKWGRR